MQLMLTLCRVLSTLLTTTQQPSNRFWGTIPNPSKPCTGQAEKSAEARAFNLGSLQILTEFQSKGMEVEVLYMKESVKASFEGAVQVFASMSLSYAQNPNIQPWGTHIIC